MCPTQPGLLKRDGGSTTEEHKQKISEMEISTKQIELTICQALFSQEKFLPA